jgi:hypothetical protein
MPEPGSRWFAREMQAVYEVVGMDEDYDGMVKVKQDGSERTDLLIPCESFGSRLVPLEETDADA